MPKTPVLLHDHNEFLEENVFLKGRERRDMRERREREDMRDMREREETEAERERERERK